MSNIASYGLFVIFQRTLNVKLWMSKVFGSPKKGCVPFQCPERKFGIFCSATWQGIDSQSTCQLAEIDNTIKPLNGSSYKQWVAIHIFSSINTKVKILKTKPTKIQVIPIAAKPKAKTGDQCQTNC